MTKVTSYAPMFTFRSGETVGNAQRFATEPEAMASAAARFAVWTMPTGYSVAESSDAVNYKRVGGADVATTSTGASA